MAFRLRFRGRKLLVEVGHGRVTYSLLEGPALEIVHHGRRATVPAQRPLERAIPALKAREAPSQPRGRAPGGRDRSAERQAVAANACSTIACAVAP